MSLLVRTSPHAKGALTTAQVMRWVLAAAVPGIVAQTVFFGWGTLIQVLWCAVLALLTEATLLALQKKPILDRLQDSSALVTALLLGVALPALTPSWVSATAIIFSIIFAKQLYGGIGYNPFNPAMVGYALVLISFPVAMTTNWIDVSQGAASYSFNEAMGIIFGGGNPDAYTGATALDHFKQANDSESSIALGERLFGFWGSANAWNWINLCYLLGGLVLIWRGVIQWRIPVAVLAGMVCIWGLLALTDDHIAPVGLHLLGGATMIGAFFIATDPVSASTTPLGKLIYGFGIGALVIIIRSYGAYPDAIAFAVLLMNFAAPLIDAYTQPRTYGHRKATRGLKKHE